MNHKTTFRKIACFWLTITMVLAAQPTEKPLLRIATKEAAPFSMKQPDGTWRGISIDLWERIAKNEGYRFEYKEMSLEEMLQSLENGSVDLAVAALTITPEREARFDFSHTFYTTGLSVAVPASGGNTWWQLFLSLFSLDFLRVVGALVLLLLVVGALVWLVERRRNPEQFGGSAAEGLGAGFWWSAVTMTTVGYGDKAPVTFWGRILGLIWMFMAIIIISSFTAGIASALTVNQLQSKVSTEDDLRHVKVATVRGSTSENYLQKDNIGARSFEDIRGVLDAVRDGKVDAAVYDAPILRYLVKTEYRGELMALPFTFSRQDYGIAMPDGSQLREPLNRALLSEIRRPEWENVLSRYLGK